MTRRLGKSRSSPLARGLPGARSPTVRPAGIIPARAGFTQPSPCQYAWQRDHPRSRGVYIQRTDHQTSKEGSSPLARGLPVRVYWRTMDLGIIPARAGFTTAQVGGAAYPEDHPRSRGVYHREADREDEDGGSSPLARGLPREIVGLPDYGRIIPARAGFTSAGTVRSGFRWDHPRSRGVYRPGDRTGTHHDGSSPLARGLLLDEVDQAVGVGIIPARAGFTVVLLQAALSVGDHPRSRGVYAPTLRPSPHRPGSSPLARGLPDEDDEPTIYIGIIPARAGFTVEYRRNAIVHVDHPRSRGVYAVGVRAGEY